MQLDKIDTTPRRWSNLSEVMPQRGQWSFSLTNQGSQEFANLQRNILYLSRILSFHTCFRDPFALSLFRERIFTLWSNKLKRRRRRRERQLFPRAIWAIKMIMNQNRFTACLTSDNVMLVVLFTVWSKNRVLITLSFHLSNYSELDHLLSHTKTRSDIDDREWANIHGCRESMARSTPLSHLHHLLVYKLQGAWYFSLQICSPFHICECDAFVAKLFDLRVWFLGILWEHYFVNVLEHPEHNASCFFGFT